MISNRLIKLASFVLLSIFSLNSFGDIISQIEDKNGYFFDQLFDRELYDFKQTNKYDAEFNPRVGALTLNESSADKIVRLKARKRFWVKKELTNDIDEHIVLLEEIDLQKLAISAVKGVIAGATTAMILKRMAHRTAQASLKGGFVLGAGLAVADAALDVYFNDEKAQQIREAKQLKDQILREIENEKNFDYEQKLINEWSSLESSYRDAIIQNLLKARNNHNIGERPNWRDILSDIFEFPREVIVVPSTNQDLRESDTDQMLTNREEFLDDVFPSLVDGGQLKDREAGEHLLDSDHYSEKARKGFKLAMERICDYSWDGYHGVEKPVIKRGIGLVGPQGTGKTWAAKEISRLSGLPIYELKITSESSFSNEELYGEAPNAFSSGKKGHVPKAMLKKLADGTNGKNIIILMDDVDRNFLNADQTTNMAGLESFLLSFLDPETVSFNAEFYGIEGFDLRHIIVIATMNGDIRKVQRFAALADRMEIIDVEQLGDEQRKNAIKQMVEERLIKRSRHFRDSNREELKQKIADFMVNNFVNIGGRTEINRVHDLLRCPENKWPEFAADQDWQRIDE